MRTIMNRPEQKQRMRENNPGRFVSAEAKAEIVRKNRGKKRTPEQRARLSAAVKQSWVRRKAERQ
jgi:hypothetical protein